MESPLLSLNNEQTIANKFELKQTHGHSDIPQIPLIWPCIYIYMAYTPYLEHF